MIKNFINTFFSSLFRVLGRFLAYGIVGVAFYLLAGYLGLLNVQARTLSYIYGGTNNGLNDLTENNQILDLNSNWDYGSNFFASNDPVFMNTGLYFYATNLNGNILQVNADYYVGINVRRPVDSYVDYYYTDYTSSSRNVYTSSNLRCSVNELYQSGYDSSSSPEISNFLVELEEGNYNYGGIQTHYRYHIRFNYKQLLSSNKNGNSNISCWFNLPSNELQGQFIGSKDKLNSNVGIFAKTTNLSYSVSSDPNTGLLTNIVDQNNTLINQNQQIIDKQQQVIDSNKDINDTLKNEDISDIDFSFSGIEDTSDTPISDMILLPITLLNKLNDSTSSSCTSWVMPFDFQGGNNVLELPCIKLETYLGSDLVGIIDDLICIFMTWSIIMAFVSFFNDITGLRDTYDSMYQPKHAYTGYKPKHGKE